MATPTVNTKIWLALRARVESLPVDLPVLWPGTNTSLPTGNALEVSHMVNRPDRLLLKGSAPHNRLGILQIGVLSKKTSNEHHETVVREIAGDVADHFVVDLLLRYDDVTVKVYEAPEVGSSFVDDARNRYVTPVSIRWRCFA